MASYEINADMTKINIVLDIFNGVRNSTLAPLKANYHNDIMSRIQSFGAQGVDVSKAQEYARNISNNIFDLDNKFLRGCNYLEQVKDYVSEMERNANRKIEITADAAKALLGGQRYASTGMSSGKLTTITLGNTGAFAGSSLILKGMSSVKDIGTNVKTPLAGFTAYSAKLSKDALNNSKVATTKTPTAGFTSYSAKLANDALKGNLGDSTKANVSTSGTKSAQPSKSYAATNSNVTNNGTRSAVENNTAVNEPPVNNTQNTGVVGNVEKTVTETVTNTQPNTSPNVEVNTNPTPAQNVTPNTDVNTNPTPGPSSDSGIRIIEETPATETSTAAPVNNTPSSNSNSTQGFSYTNRGASTGNVSYTPQSEVSIPKDTPITDANVTGSTTDLFDATDYEDLSNASSTVGTSRTTGGTPVIPIAVGLGAAAAVGVGAKVYKDRKENNEFDLNEDRVTNDNKYWTMEDSNVIHSEKEDYVDTDTNSDVVNDTLIEEQPVDVKYTAQSNNIQIDDDDDINKDTWSMPDTPVESTTDLFNN